MQDPLISDSYIVKRLENCDSRSVYVAALKSGSYDGKKLKDLRRITIKVTGANVTEAKVLKELASSPSHYGKRYILETFKDNLDDASRADVGAYLCHAVHSICFTESVFRPSVSLIDYTYGSLALHLNNQQWKSPHFFKKAAFRIFAVVKVSILSHTLR